MLWSAYFCILALEVVEHAIKTDYFDRKDVNILGAEKYIIFHSDRDNLVSRIGSGLISTSMNEYTSSDISGSEARACRFHSI